MACGELRPAWRSPPVLLLCAAEATVVASLAPVQPTKPGASPVREERVESFHARRRSRMRMTTNENLPKALHGGHR
uniref:Secreted protein n=1 Tax=Oryza barthii TaxID=65489 RepID=A0A0D3F5C7_9ORYZ